LAKGAALNLSVLKSVGRTECLSSFYAEAVGVPATIVSRAHAGSNGGRATPNGATPGRPRQGSRPNSRPSTPQPLLSAQDRLAVGAPDKARPFAPRPQRDHDASGGHDPRRSPWPMDVSASEDEVPRAVATTSSFSVRPGSYASEAVRTVPGGLVADGTDGTNGTGCSTGTNGSPSLTEATAGAAHGAAAHGAASGGGGHGGGTGQPRLRKNKLQNGKPPSAQAVEELRGELRTVLQSHQQSIEGLFAQLRADLQQAGALPARPPTDRPPQPQTALYDA